MSTQLMLWAVSTLAQTRHCLCECCVWSNATTDIWWLSFKMVVLILVVYNLPLVICLKYNDFWGHSGCVAKCCFLPLLCLPPSSSLWHQTRALVGLLCCSHQSLKNYISSTYDTSSTYATLGKQVLSHFHKFGVDLVSRLSTSLLATLQTNQVLR